MYLEALIGPSFTLLWVARKQPPYILIRIKGVSYMDPPNRSLIGIWQIVILCHIRLDCRLCKITILALSPHE